MENTIKFNDEFVAPKIEEFEKAQKIRMKKVDKFKLLGHEKQLYSFTSKIECGLCGASYQHKTTKYNQLWICETYNKYGKSECSSKQIPNKQLEGALCRYLGVNEFDDDLFKEKIRKIIALPNNELKLVLTNGKTEIIKWTDPTRKDSWTPEMKEKARLRSLGKEV